MESIIRNIRDIDSSERQVLEHVLGKKLRDNQQVIIQIVTVGGEPIEERAPAPATGLPDWCNVFDGLTDAEIADLESVVRQRADVTRPS